jgi:hypothetical protein
MFMRLKTKLVQRYKIRAILPIIALVPPMQLRTTILENLRQVRPVSWCRTG